jgi:aminoglycoside phosphotransferase (APT) family kinase protein
VGLKPVRRPDPLTVSGLGPWLASAVAASRVDVVASKRLAGGAVQENWQLDIVVADGPRQGAHSWLLRTDAAARIPVSLDRGTEYDVLALAHQRGIAVAEPIARSATADLLGAPFLVQQLLPGSAQPHVLLRDKALVTYADSLAVALAEQLARIHAIRPGSDVTVKLPLPAAIGPARNEVARLRKALDNAGEPRPALEYILCWLHDTAPPAGDIVLVHGDFRTGNYLVDGGRLAGVLDWEFAHWGDRHEDLGWFTARCWRFGRDADEAGGIAKLGVFLDAYNAAAGTQITPESLVYWQIMAAAKWATIAVLQGDRYRRHGEERLELALTGLMAPEMEFDALTAIKALGQT